MQSRGFSLGNTVILVSVAATLAFTVAAQGVFHMNYAMRNSNGDLAQNLAESTVSMAFQQILAKHEFGMDRAADAKVELRLNGGVGRLTFSNETARAWGLPASTNNLDGDTSLAGYDATRPVPKAAVQLVATGRVGGVTRTVETVLYVPPFPYAMASAGRFQSDGKLEVGGVSRVDDIKSLTSIDPSNLLAANVVSNGSDNSSGKALILGPDSHISGDVRSHGQVELGKNVVVGGQVRTGADQIKIPKFFIEANDPDPDPSKTGEVGEKPNVQVVTPGSLAAPTVEGFNRCEGDLLVNGGLKLDNGILYVKGNLQVTGGISGTGAVFVTKNVKLLGSNDLRSDNTVAVMSGGDVTINGAGSYTSSFQGMLYNEGNFTADRVSLLGVFIQNQPDATVRISDSQLVHVDEIANRDIDIQYTVPSGVQPGQHDTLVCVNGHFHDATSLNADDHGNYMFEMYQVQDSSGKRTWEFVDPNGPTTVTGLATVQDAAQALYSNLNGYLLKTRANPYAKKLGLPNNYLMSLTKDGRVVPMQMKQLDSWDKFLAQFNEVQANYLKSLPIRKPGASALYPPPEKKTYTVSTNPNRFLTLDDTARVLFWKAR